ncbi:hypothetical protein [Alteromonas halophila]|uniref:Membrane protein n=1 Tax=Alteromonas halophila TaxID=516698 RepID=A0A918MY85_9ALTE|nr:hypothetical protein [Alteromonas halophila]GGW84913.1 membrane protein [Alteromonas halophila]
MQRRPPMASPGLSLLIVVLALAYPFLVYQFVDSVRPLWFACVLFLAFTLRFMLLGQARQRSDTLMFGVVTAFCLGVAMLNSQQLLKFYPVLMSVGMGLIFLVSLSKEQCLIDKFARLAGNTPPPEAQGYLRTLTLLWGLLLIANGAVSAYTACYTSLSVWTLYNGFLSYLLIACFACGEWVYRGYYKKKHNITDD